MRNVEEALALSPNPDSWFSESGGIVVKMGACVNKFTGRKKGSSLQVSTSIILIKLVVGPLLA